MAVTVEMHNTGDPALRAEVVSVIEHILSDRPGDWRVSIVGSQANDGWELKIIGRMPSSAPTRWNALPKSMSRPSLEASSQGWCRAGRGRQIPRRNLVRIDWDPVPSYFPSQK